MALDVLPSQMTLEVLVTCAVHLFTAFSFAFVLVIALIGWLVPLLYCLYASCVVVVVAVVALLSFRIRPPKQAQRQAFFGANWPSVNIGHRGCASDAPENTNISFREVGAYYHCSNKQVISITITNTILVSITNN